METTGKIALLIDCENVSFRSVSGVLNELSQYGVTNIRRAYANWKSPSMHGWEQQLHPFAVVPVQQFAYTSGKNAVDSAIIIDAMDLLYTKSLDAFALMTSDSDFTPLVMRILADGLKVYGFGEKKTPEAFVKACSQFIYTENIEIPDEVTSATDGTATPTRKSRKELRGDTSLVRLLRTAVEQTADDNGWSHLARVGSFISNSGSLSPVNYGYKKWSDLLRVSELFEIEHRNNGSEIYLRPKPRRAKSAE
ncbi:MAG: NYN domain-containing protein [Planctomycetaceae bacterium]|nr:NYN domain-containing protein [Planctomycetaceae bacterium]